MVDRAVKRTRKLKQKLMGRWPKGRSLVRMLGRDAAGKLFDVVLASGYVTPQIADGNRSDEQVLDVVDHFLVLEIENLQRTALMVGSLVGKLDSASLAAMVANNQMAPQVYGVQPGDSDAMAAARWVCNASNTARGNVAEIDITRRIIERAVAVSPLTTLQSLDTINTILMEGGGRAQARGPVPLPMPSPLPSSMGGRYLLEVAAGFVSGRVAGNHNCRYADLGCYLLGITIGCHGFPDANGRTGRVLYAICQIRAGAGFTGLSTDGEELLHKLPAQ